MGAVVISWLAALVLALGGVTDTRSCDRDLRLFQSPFVSLDQEALHLIFGNLKHFPCEMERPFIIETILGVGNDAVKVSIDGSASDVWLEGNPLPRQNYSSVKSVTFSFFYNPFTEARNCRITLPDATANIHFSPSDHIVSNGSADILHMELDRRSGIVTIKPEREVRTSLQRQPGAEDQRAIGTPFVG